MIQNFAAKVEEGRFFTHREIELEPGNRQLTNCRGLMYYLMEELPYIPPALYPLWFRTEELMLRKAVEEASLLNESFEKSLSSDSDSLPLNKLRMHRLHILRLFKNFTITQPGSIDHNLAYKIKRNYIFDSYESVLKSAQQV